MWHQETGKRGIQMTNEILYLKIEQNNLVRKPIVRVQDVGKIVCERDDILRQVKQMVFYRFQGNGKKQVQTFSVLLLVQMIQKKYPGITVDNLGETDFIVHFVPEEEAKIWQLLKTCLICGVLFFGAAFMIMTFITDVSVTDVFDQFYRQVTGTDATGINSLEIGFCIGLPVGILVFYNHLGKKKLTDDPTPVQVAMRKYEQDVDTTYIEASSREGKMIDAD